MKCFNQLEMMSSSTVSILYLSRLVHRFLCFTSFSYQIMFYSSSGSYRHLRHDDAKCFRDVSSLFSVFNCQMQFFRFDSIYIFHATVEEGKNIFSYEEDFFTVAWNCVKARKRERKINKLLICCRGKAKNCSGCERKREGGRSKNWHFP